ncbi:hypothetical protein SAMN05216325_10665 [Nitrosomonas marina]|uniref:Uncharacterized protein n=1 Tax=Nitrosomonas marina TaxID=917 RepID=A0A1H8D838_9PROT|nr:hypothetical protein SAMN05216325_10665 [Nitrosomonas marina]
MVSALAVFRVGYDNCMPAGPLLHEGRDACHGMPAATIKESARVYIQKSGVGVLIP